MKRFLPFWMAFLLTGCSASDISENSMSASEENSAVLLESQNYRMQPGPELDCPYLFAEENTPYYGIPFESPVNGTISNQLVWVETTVYAGECPDCSESGPWALVNWGIFDAAIDTVCWVCTCHLRPYSAEDAEIITYPVKVKDGITVSIRKKEVPSEELSEARVTSRTETEISLSWVGGNSVKLPLNDILVPSPEIVNSIPNSTPDWATLFTP